MSEEKKAPGTAVVTWKEKMAMVTAQASSMEATKGGFLSFKNGRMSYDDTPIPGDKMDVIVVDFLLENGIFKEKYNANKPATPMCYALGRDEETLAPHPDCDEPQAPKCGTPGQDGCCPHNEWASDPEGGRGKACRNTRRVAIIAADSIAQGAEGIKKANVLMCKIPVTSLKFFSKFINQATKVLESPPFAVPVQLSVTPSANMFDVNWKVLNKIEDQALLEALYNKHVSIEKQMFQPYPKLDDEPASVKSGKY